MTDQATPAKVRLTDELGPLPKPYGFAQPSTWQIGIGNIPVFTADQMRAYAAEHVAAERELWRELVRRVGKDGNRYGLEGCAATCESSENGAVITWTMGTRA